MIVIVAMYLCFAYCPGCICMLLSDRFLLDRSRSNKRIAIVHDLGKLHGILLCNLTPTLFIAVLYRGMIFWGKCYECSLLFVICHGWYNIFVSLKIFVKVCNQLTLFFIKNTEGSIPMKAACIGTVVTPWVKT